MRVSLLLSLSLSLSLAVLSLAASDAAAQPTPCDQTEGISDFEVAVKVDPAVEALYSAVRFTVYDYRGRPLTPTSVYDGDPIPDANAHPVTQPEVVLQTGRPGCTAYVNFNNGQVDHHDPYAMSINYQYGGPNPRETNPNTVRIEYMNGSSVAMTRYLFYAGSSNTQRQCSNGPGASPFSFLCPNSTDAFGNGDYYIGVVPSGLRVSPNHMWLGGGALSHYIDETIPDDGWVWPYHAQTICANGRCSSGHDWTTSSTYLIMPVDYVVNLGQPLTKKVTGVAPMTLPANGHYNWTESWLTLAFRPGGGIEATSADFNVSGMKFTAADLASGWAGVRFGPGSSGGWSGVTVERVAGGALIFPGFTVLDGEAVRVQDASPTFTDLTIQNAVPGSTVNGLAVYGPTSAPIVTNLTVRDMTGQGVVASAGARPALNRGTFTRNAGAAVAAGGSGSVVYLAPEDVGNGLRGAQITDNPGGGVAASASGAVMFSVPIAIPGVPPDGFTTVADNPGRGLSTTGGGVLYAGALNQQRKNRIFSNGGVGNPSGNARASGTGSAIYARCNWWNTEVAPFRTLAVSGGFRDVSAPLAQDPYQNPNAACGVALPSRQAGGASLATTEFAEGDVAGRSSETALERLAAALDAATPAEAAAGLASLVADEPDTEEAAAALGEAGVLASQAGAPEAAVALLTSSATSPYAALRVAAGQALVASRRAQGDLPGALAAADALASEGAEAQVQAELARVYLYYEAGDAAQAEGALSSLEGLAPESVEAQLARSFLEAGGEAPVAGRGAGAETAGAARLATEAAAAAVMFAERAASETVLAVWPNPASTSGASVSLVLAEASEATVVVYDLLGRAVATPLAGTLAAGVHRAEVNAGVLAPGVYVVRASVRASGIETVQTVRLTVLR